MILSELSQPWFYGVELLEKHAHGEVGLKIYDIYPKRLSEKIINVKYELIDKLIGVKIDRKIINNILTNLGFGLSDAPKQGLTLLEVRP